MQNGTPKMLCCKRGGSLVSLASPAIRGHLTFLKIVITVRAIHFNSLILEQLSSLLAEVSFL